MEPIAHSAGIAEHNLLNTDITSTQNALETTKTYIYNIDFSNIINKMTSHHSWKRKDVEKVCGMYRHFLWLHKKYESQYALPPSEEIDEFWHNHILDTQQYRKDCQIIFGKYLDHYPYLGIDEKTDRNDLNNFFAKTAELYEKETGQPLVHHRVHGFRGALIRILEKLDRWMTK